MVMVWYTDGKRIENLLATWQPIVRSEHHDKIIAAYVPRQALLGGNVPGQYGRHTSINTVPGMMKAGTCSIIEDVISPLTVWMGVLWITISGGLSINLLSIFLPCSSTP